jgi:integrase
MSYRGGLDRYILPALGRGELCSLRWSDVDIDQGEILIAGGVARVHGQPLIDKDTKTHANRRVAVGAGTLDLLKAHRVEQAKTALACGVTLAADAHVFSHAPAHRRPRCSSWSPPPPLRPQSCLADPPAFPNWAGGPSSNGATSRAGAPYGGMPTPFCGGSDPPITGKWGGGLDPAAISP